MRRKMSWLIEAHPDHVWDTLTDPAMIPLWSYKEGRLPYIISVTAQADDWLMAASDGQSAHHRIIEQDDYRFVLQQIDGFSPQTNSFSLAVTENGHCELTWQAELELPHIILDFTGRAAVDEYMAGSLAELAILASKVVTNAAE